MNVPILMYHSISSSSQPDIRPDGYWLSPEEFQGHLRILSNAGANSITLSQLSGFCRGENTLPDKPVIITFDDGYLNNLKEAFPLLINYRFKATFFITAGTIGKRHMLSGPDLLELQKNGMTIGSHGFSHELYRGKTSIWLKNELLESKAILEDILSGPVNFFSLPRGYLPPSLVKIIPDTGYKGMCTSSPGKNHRDTPVYLWKRFAIRTGDQGAAIQAILQGRSISYLRLYSREKARALLRSRHFFRRNPHKD